MLTSYVLETPAGSPSGLVLTSALLVKTGVRDENDKLVIRPYTPIEPMDTKGHIDLLIKHYVRTRC